MYIMKFLVLSLRLKILHTAERAKLSGPPETATRNLLDLNFLKSFCENQDINLKFA